VLSFLYLTWCSGDCRGDSETSRAHACTRRKVRETHGCLAAAVDFGRVNRFNETTYHMDGRVAALGEECFFEVFFSI